jgi:DNA-binding transcriptional MerR regulator
MLMKPEVYYTATEVAKMLGISKQTLIRYESKRIFPRARRNAVNKWREYNLRDIRTLKRILGRGK